MCLENSSLLKPKYDCARKSHKIYKRKIQPNFTNGLRFIIAGHQYNFREFSFPSMFGKFRLQLLHATFA